MFEQHQKKIRSQLSKYEANPILKSKYKINCAELFLMLIFSTLSQDYQNIGNSLIQGVCNKQCMFLPLQYMNIYNYITTTKSDTFKEKEEKY